MAKQRNTTKSKTRKKPKVQKSLATAFHCPAPTPSTPPAIAITKKGKPPTVTTPSPSNHDSVPESTPLTSNKIIDHPIDEPTNITEQQEPPPNAYMENSNPSYLSVAHHSKDLPVVQRPVSTSFRLLKIFMINILHKPTIVSIFLTMKLSVKALSPLIIIESVRQ